MCSQLAKYQQCTPMSDDELLEKEYKCYIEKRKVLVALDELFDSDFKQKVNSYAKNKFKGMK
jgi:hypothetical protein